MFSICACIASTTCCGTTRACKVDPRFETALTSLRSLSSMKVTAVPFFPARAVRPTLCKYELSVRGASKEITASTPAMSRPRAATSVATRCDASPTRKLSSAARRMVWVKSPCNSAVFIPESPIRIFSRCAQIFVRAKTIVFVVNVRVTRDSRCASLFAAAPGRSRRTSSTKVPGVVPIWSALSRAGFFMENSAKSSTPEVSVALKRSVCRRRGQCLKISRISSRNPISKSRSASSSTRAARSSSPTLWVFRTWSISRPGVATTISGRVRSDAACTVALKPPTTSAARMVVNCASFSVMEWTCTASSRTGTSTKT
mmetsp:Transcript_8319/g.31104  ORF Transcript_8319/g.31104 Transcript_8319/m.31104 type:complete len:315 (+) Transcript_8319:240-1184(+)